MPDDRPGRAQRMDRERSIRGRAEVAGVPGSSAVELVARLRASGVDAAAVDGLRVTVDRLCAQYAYLPADQLLHEARGWLTRITALRDRGAALALRRELLVLTGRLTLLLGCVEFDSGWRRRAEAARQVAMAMGRESGHSGIVGWGHEMGAWFSLTAGDIHGVMACVEAGTTATCDRNAAVQLHVQAAKAWARLGDRRRTNVALDAGRRLLDALPYPENPDDHFVVDPAKWDFYLMDCYRTAGEDRLADALAREVLRAGTERAPMRLAEAHVTLATVAARNGDLEGAIAYGRQALRADRRSLPSLTMILGDLEAVLAQRYPAEPVAREFVHHLRELRPQG
ncbi:tetratricopeptide repeat protein [Streptomyces sp. NPDC018031]|uniref:tetratricopeptide repeat protein n=1 Tax=Streptomyces sp. NPDC018031 TaxID=3365033 RepID=UPI003799CA13